MPAFDLINVQIALGGDIRAVVAKAVPENPVTWPEYQILAFIHGEGSMRGAEISGETVTRTAAEERERLMGLYGEEAIKEVFGGRAGTLPHKAPDELPKASKKKPAKAAGREKPDPDDDSEGTPPEPEPVEPEPKPGNEPDEEEGFPPAPPPPVAKPKVKALPR